MKTIYFLKKLMRASFLVALMCFTFSLSAGETLVETTVFADDFSGENLSGGTPATTYTFLKQNISGTAAADPSYNNNMMRVPAPKSSANRNAVLGGLSVYSAPFASKLSEIDADSVVWTFNFKANRNTTSGFTDADFGIATILLADAADYTSANGYAVVSYNKNSSTTRSFRLVKFTNGLNDNTKFTDLVIGIVGDANLYCSFRVTYIKSSNIWKFYCRNDAGVFADPAQGTFTTSGSAIDDTFVNTPMSYFGFHIMCKSYTTDTNLDADNYTVRTYKTDILQSNENLQANTGLFKTRTLSGAVEIETVSAQATLCSLTGAVQQIVNIKGKATIKVPNKGLYILKVALPDGRSGIEKVLIQ